jgi:flagellar motor switch/type III secretory pathway protein FliN
MDELSAERTDEKPVGGSARRGAASAENSSPHSVALQEALGSISLRVWAELGRARMPLGSALGLPVGAVLDLDRTADAPVDLYVNGMRFARGQLLVTEEGEWAVSLEGLESEGLRMLDLARSARLQAREAVESDSEPLDSASDQPIETEASITNPEIEASTPNPETPNLKQPEVEGAVT